MSRLLYQIYVFLLGPFFKVAALFNNKAALAHDGRKQTFNTLRSFKKEHPDQPVWFHVSSLGELEQTYPIIEKLKSRGELIIVSFFSPSGFVKHPYYKAIDCAIYLPLDSPSLAKKTVALIAPKLCIWVKYDFWFNHLKEINNQHIPLYLIAAKFDQKHFLFSGILKGLQKKLAYFDHIFTQDEVSFRLLQKTGFKSSSVAGDPRIDRVLNRPIKEEVVDYIKDFKGDKTLICFASIHKEQFKIAADFIKNNPEYKYLLAPHEVDQIKINKLAIRVDNPEFYTARAEKRLSSNTLILDTIGDLFSAYAACDIIYVGGGFDKGIHNILEPAIFKKRILIGPNFKHFKEAKELIQMQLITSIQDQNELANNLKLLLKTDPVKIESGLNMYFAQARGATDIITPYLTKKLDKI